MGYSDAEKRESVRKARQLLAELDRRDALLEAEVVDAAASDDALTASEDAPAVPWQKNLNAYGINFDPHNGKLERWKAEGEELERRRKQAIADRKEQERQDREQRMRASADWNEWFEQRFDELRETRLFTEPQMELLAMLLASARKEMLAAVGALRAELTVQRAAADKASERDGPILDLPVLRRNGSQR